MLTIWFVTVIGDAITSCACAWNVYRLPHRFSRYISMSLLATGGEAILVASAIAIWSFVPGDSRYWFFAPLAMGRLCKAIANAKMSLYVTGRTNGDHPST